jgi:GTP-binding protein HflX
VVVGREIQRRPDIDPATFVGSGKVQEIAAHINASGANLVIFDQELTPSQLRNLENQLGVPVIDRTALILDIFALRARTREAKLQVLLAQLQYRLPRLTGSRVDLSRLGGGIGTRGPGETKLEVDRRRIREQMADLRRELQEVQAHRVRLRQERQRSGLPVVSLVGYTNAGKSTLMNRLSGAGVYAENQLFATLDTTVRQVDPPDGEPFLLTDTVGFVRRLPTSLVAAFRSTLEETLAADLLLHVVDSSSPQAEDQMATVHRVLRELGAQDKPTLMVFNKVDAVAAEEDLLVLLRSYPRSVAVSAATGEGIDELLAAIAHALQDRREVLEVEIPYAQSALVSWIHQRGRILAEEHRENGTFLRVELEKALAGQVKHRLGLATKNKEEW